MQQKRGHSRDGSLQGQFDGDRKRPDNERSLKCCRGNQARAPQHAQHDEARAPVRSLQQQLSLLPEAMQRLVSQVIGTVLAQPAR